MTPLHYSCQLTKDKIAFPGGMYNYYLTPDQNKEQLDKAQRLKVNN